MHRRGTAGRRGGGTGTTLAAVFVFSVPLSLCPAPLLSQCPDGTPPPCARTSVRGAIAIDTHVVAVLPFRVSGVDTSLAEGLAELLAVQFTGEGTPRAADMGSVVRAWRTAGGTVRLPLAEANAQQVAARVGAAMVLTGSAVGTGTRLSLTARLTRGRDGATLAQVGPVLGNADSLPELLQAVAAGLISAPIRGGLRGVNLEALRAYMVGRAAYHRSDWQAAGLAFLRAFAADTTFALAALSYVQTRAWTSSQLPNDSAVQRLAWTYRDRLDAVNRAILVAYLGSRFPAPGSVAERIDAQLAVTRLAPTSAEAWFWLGDALFHSGELVLPDALAQSRRAFEQALALDSTMAEAALHLGTLNDYQHDTAAGLRYTALTLRLAPQSTYALVARLENLVWSGRAKPVLDSIERAGPPYPASLGPYFVVAAGLGQPGSWSPRLVQSNFEYRIRAATTPELQSIVAWQLTVLHLNRGQIGAAAALTSGDDRRTRARRVRMALFADGDPRVAATDAGALADEPSNSFGTCLVGAWWVAAGDTAAAARMAARLRGAPADPTGGVAGWCGPYLDAAIAVAQRRPDALALTGRADSTFAQGMPTRDGWDGLAMGRLWAALGDWPRALRAVRRREYLSQARTAQAEYLVVRLRAEMQWATLAGDTAGAVRAARHYLLLRDDPDPPLMPQRDSVRAELAALTRRP